MKYLVKTIGLGYLINFSTVFLTYGKEIDKTNPNNCFHNLKAFKESNDNKAPKRGKPIRGNGN